jgi:fructose-bisphosphate aldolase, class I
MDAHELRSTASALVAPGKGILAADESTPTLTKRLESLGIPTGAEVRRFYRSMLTTTPGASEQISGVILYDETIRQSTIEGTKFPEQLRRDGFICGIKVDTGAKDLAGAPGEKVTEGLDGLRDRLNEYRELGARFAKWRAVIAIGEDLPSLYCIGVNAHALARYAILCQGAGLVPIVEPEVLMDGDHTIERCYEATARTLHALFGELFAQRVLLEGILLKANMVLPGKDCPEHVSIEEVAQQTLRCLRSSVPAAVPGIVFLSGGQSSRQATSHLNAMNNMGPHPWELSFSFARALQQPALDAWKGEESNFGAGQDAFHHRVKLTSLARAGKYTADMERT